MQSTQHFIPIQLSQENRRNDDDNGKHLQSSNKILENKAKSKNQIELRNQKRKEQIEKKVLQKSLKSLESWPFQARQIFFGLLYFLELPDILIHTPQVNGTLTERVATIFMREIVFGKASNESVNPGKTPGIHHSNDGLILACMIDAETTENQTKKILGLATVGTTGTSVRHFLSVQFDFNNLVRQDTSSNQPGFETQKKEISIVCDSSYKELITSTNDAVLEDNISFTSSEFCDLETWAEKLANIHNLRSEQIRNESVKIDDWKHVLVRLPIPSAPSEEKHYNNFGFLPLQTFRRVGLQKKMQYPAAIDARLWSERQSLLTKPTVKNVSTSAKKGKIDGRLLSTKTVSEMRDGMEKVSKQIAVNTSISSHDRGNDHTLQGSIVNVSRNGTNIQANSSNLTSKDHTLQCKTLNETSNKVHAENNVKLSSTAKEKRKRSKVEDTYSTASCKIHAENNVKLSSTAKEKRKRSKVEDPYSTASFKIHAENNVKLSSTTKDKKQSKEKKRSKVEDTYSTASYKYIRQFINHCFQPGRDYPHAPMGEIWVEDNYATFSETSNQKNMRTKSHSTGLFNVNKFAVSSKVPVPLDGGRTLLGRRWVWDEGHYTDGICFTKVDIYASLTKKISNTTDSFIPVSKRAFCDCGLEARGINSNDNKNVNRGGFEVQPRRSERYGTSVRISNVSPTWFDYVLFYQEHLNIFRSSISKRSSMNLLMVDLIHIHWYVVMIMFLVQNFVSFKSKWKGHWKMTQPIPTT
jgi:hypothetical protein